MPKQTMTRKFTEYIEYYPEGLDKINECLRHSHLHYLENVALRFSHAIEEHVLDLKSGNENTFLIGILAKSVNEMFATIGSLRNGALNASFHHPRCLNELFATLEYVYSKSDKFKHRMEKYIEYPHFNMYKHFLYWKQKLAENKISEDEFGAGCKVSKKDFDNLKESWPKWQKLWKLKSKDADFSKIQSWHFPASIKDLFHSTDRVKAVWETYEMICHATHFSPLGGRLAGGNALIGFPHSKNGFDYLHINKPIDLTILAAQNIAIILYEKIKAGLIEGVFEWIPEQDGA